MRHKKTVAISIPTGVGAEIGGYAGDGGKIARMFAEYFNVIVHPNVVNGGILSAMTDDMLYVEGFAFDEFFKGNISLEPLKPYEQNKIGVVFDKSIPKDVLNVHINTIYAQREVLGRDIPYYEITDEPVGVEFFIKNNISTGVLKNEKTLLNSAKKLISKGCSAICAVCFFGEDADSIEYENGNGIDPVGGIEAVISHYLTKELIIPAAHAPAFSSVEILNKISNSKTAAENISSTYMPSVIEGLSRAPKLSKNGSIKNSDIYALIIPHRAFGGIAPIAAVEFGIKICAVKNKIFGGLYCSDIGADDIMVYEDYKKCLEALL
ncbi:MAG: DUF3326 domain-containing protein [Candidatus Gastranaerophilales bacterium]|nr:DUF3326 domain-containing protein [Candidatus Gastranaerophilales bacterium]